ncbi:MAG: baseplate J/gp47 family protein [Sutterella sp.]|nr:baseplate J/gp47 family protein [Sutterella sp.]
MPSLTFNPELGVELPSTPEIRSEVESKIKEIFASGNRDEPTINTDPTAPMGQVIDLFVAEIEAKNSAIAFLVNMFGRSTSTGSFLDALNSLYFLERKVSEPTLIDCLCTGLQGTRIPFGATVKDANGNHFRCMTPLGVTIGASGQAIVQFAAVDHGALIVQPNTVTDIVTTVPGWNSVTNPAAGVTGRDRESDAEYRSRASESVSINAHSTVDSILANVAALTGVIDCAVLENVGDEPIERFGVTIGGHSIAICVAGGEDTAIADVIYRKKDAGCGTSGNTVISTTDPNYSASRYEYRIVRPKVTNLYIQVEFFDSTIGDSVKKKIKEAIVNDTLGLGSKPRLGLAQELYGSRFWQTIAQVTNAPVRSVTMALGSPTNFKDSITINADIEPTVTTETVTITFVGG